jgi:hypothetical protein
MCRCAPDNDKVILAGQFDYQFADILLGSRAAFLHLLDAAKLPQLAGSLRQRIRADDAR